MVEGEPWLKDKTLEPFDSVKKPNPKDGSGLVVTRIDDGSNETYAVREQVFKNGRPDRNESPTQLVSVDATKSEGASFVSSQGSIAITTKP